MNKYEFPYVFLHPLLHTHICICKQNHNDDTIKTSDTVLKKNIPLTLLKGLCVRGKLETEQNCNILTPTLLAITAFLSRSPGLLNRGPLCWVLVFSTASYLQLLNRWPKGPPLLGAGLLYRILSPTYWTSCAPSYIFVQRPPSSRGRHKSHSFNPSTVKVIFWYSPIGCTCYLHRCISYFDSPARLEVNIQHHVNIKNAHC